MMPRLVNREVVLLPGQWWFGGDRTVVRTVLGSCVAVTLWHAGLRMGGMCHYMLPERGVPRNARRRSRSGGERLDGRYGDEALEHLVAEIERSGAPCAQYEAKLFGGGRMFRTIDPMGGVGASSVSDRNVVAGRELLLRHGMTCKAAHVGGYGHREVILDVESGQVWLRHTPLRGSLSLAFDSGVPP
jgi:chemotaxis protein CheD